MSTITNNILFCKAVTALKELGSTPDLEFTKKTFELIATPHLRGYTSPSTVFETLRGMGLVTLVRKEDISVVTDHWGEPMDITAVQYENLPECVKDSLHWEVSPRVRHWYKVNFLAMAQAIADRKTALSKEFDLLNSL